MGYKTVFERYELKYMLTREQKAKILDAMAPYMALDDYGRTTIRNVYFDTDSYRLVRNSIEKPVYKEKLRVRSYAQADFSSTVFVELKKKYQSIVYKRRLSMPEAQAMSWLSGGDCSMGQTQISKEIDSFINYYETLRPVVFLSYEREAYFCRSDDDFRVTFDERILCRQEELSLCSKAWGAPLLESGMTLMEIKCAGGMPLWMARALSDAKAYKTSFSKYGTAYETMIINGVKEKLRYA